MTNFTTSSFLSVPSSSSSDSTMPSLSQTPLLEPCSILEPDCATHRRWAFFGKVMTDPSYALALDAHFCGKENYSVLNLITIYRAADFTAPYADHLTKALFRVSQEAASCIAYQQRKIRNLILQTFNQMDLEPDFKIVDEKVRSPPSPTLRYPSLPTIAVITRAHNTPEATEEEWRTWFQTRESTAEPSQTQSSISTVSSLDSGPNPEPVEPFVPDSPSPSPPPLIIPTPTPKNEETLEAVPTQAETPPPIRQRNRRTKKKQELLASFGLPLSQVYPEGEHSLTLETAHEVARAEFAERRRASQLGDRRYGPIVDMGENFICRKCHELGHRHIHCPDYYCRYCWKYSPGHFTSYCPKLRGKRVLLHRSSHPEFHTELAKLESVLDRRNAKVDTELYYDITNLDVDPVIYNDARLDDC